MKERDLTWKETGGICWTLSRNQKECIQVARLETQTSISTRFSEMRRTVPGEGDRLWRKKESDRVLVKSPSTTTPAAR